VIIPRGIYVKFGRKCFNQYFSAPCNIDFTTTFLLFSTDCFFLNRGHNKTLTLFYESILQKKYNNGIPR